MSPGHQLGVIASILERLDRLEQQQRQPSGEQLTPNYLTITPDGVISAQFTGGLQLTEGTQVNPVAAPNEAIVWKDVGGAIREYVQGARQTGGPPANDLHELILASQNPAALTDYAELELQAANHTSQPTSAVVATASDAINGIAPTGRIIDSAGFSDFLQVGGNSGNGPAKSAVGFGTLQWPGGSPVSNTIIVPVPGASSTAEGVANATQVGAVFVVVRRDNLLNGTVRFAGRTVDGSSPGAGATAAFSYLIWGF